MFGGPEESMKKVKVLSGGERTRLDEKNQRIITAEIFVYSPDKMKRNLVRQMEASLYTLKLPNEVQQNQIPLGEETKEAEQTNK